MKVSYIIPTIGRNTLGRSVKSILLDDTNSHIIIEGNGNSAGKNRNMALQRVPYDTNWIVFLDDDDYFTPGFYNEIDNDYDFIVFRMNQGGEIKPNEGSEEVRFGTVGINFGIKKQLYDILKVEFDNKHAEDWRFIEKYLSLNPNIKVTEKVYYNAPVIAHLQ